MAAESKHNFVYIYKKKTSGITKILKSQNVLSISQRKLESQKVKFQN